jgi:hypothetical protein
MGRASSVVRCSSIVNYCFLRSHLFDNFYDFLLNSDTQCRRHCKAPQQIHKSTLKGLPIEKFNNIISNNMTLVHIAIDSCAPTAARHRQTVQSL